MSSINAPPARNGTSAHGQDHGILHFDATLRRKDKMRLLAEQAPSHAGQAAVAQAKPVNGRPANGRAHAPGGNGATRVAAVPPDNAFTRAADVARPAAAVPEPGPVLVAAPAPPPAASSADGMSGAALERFLIEFVVEQTGYPEEMVELDADLEADLGIDSIKKAQLFGELAEQFQIQAAEAGELSLDDFPTLRHVMQFLEQAGRRGSNAESQAADTAAATSVTVSAPPADVVADVSTAPASEAKAPAGPELERFLIGFVVEQTGYPEEMVELDADLEADLGIDSIKKAQLFGELAEHFEIRTAEAGDLSLDDFPTLRHVLNFLAGVSRKGTASNGSPPAGANGTAGPAAAARPSAPPVAASREFERYAPPEFGGGFDEGESEAGDSASMSSEELERFLIGFVVEQTGYPEEMVELDADLEADLGIDSIKKAQLFGELAEQFEIRTAETSDLSLDDFPTLRHVMHFLAGAPRKMTV